MVLRMNETTLPIASHCPFLNRSDARCSANFSLDHLDHAFTHCFGHYQACGTYLDLLVERRIRRGASGAMDDLKLDDPKAGDDAADSESERQPLVTPFVQVSVRREILHGHAFPRVAKRIAQPTSQRVADHDPALETVAQSA